MDFKIKKTLELLRALKTLRSKGKKIVFTNGCFDILHVGHIRYLIKAKRLGDILVVALNSDSSVRAMKGKDRPIIRQRDRARVLASLYFVDYVTIFDDPTPEKLIMLIRPDILAKGGDWRVKDIVGSDFVRSHGCRVVRIPFVKGYSTTSLIRKIAK